MYLFIPCLSSPFSKLHFFHFVHQDMFYCLWQVYTSIYQPESKVTEWKTVNALVLYILVIPVKGTTFWYILVYTSTKQNETFIPVHTSMYISSQIELVWSSAQESHRQFQLRQPLCEACILLYILFSIFCIWICMILCNFLQTIMHIMHIHLMLNIVYWAFFFIFNILCMLMERHKSFGGVSVLFPLLLGSPCQGKGLYVPPPTSVTSVFCYLAKRAWEIRPFSSHLEGYCPCDAQCPLAQVAAAPVLRIPEWRTRLEQIHGAHHSILCWTGTYPTKL
jgi:hypothetical protein